MAAKGDTAERWLTPAHYPKRSGILTGPPTTIRRETLGLGLTLISSSSYFPEDSERRNFSDFDEKSQYSGLG